MLGFILIMPFGVLFTWISVSSTIRRYHFRKGVLIKGKVIDHEKSYRSTRPIISFAHNGTHQWMPAYQTFSFFAPKRGEKVDIYHTEKYSDYVLLRGHNETIARICLFVMGLGLIVVAVLLLLGYLPSK